MKTFEQLIDDALLEIVGAGNDDNPLFSQINTQTAIVYALIAIAQELRDANKQRQLELLEKYGYIYEYED